MNDMQRYPALRRPDRVLIRERALAATLSLYALAVLAACAARGPMTPAVAPPRALPSRLATLHWLLDEVGRRQASGDTQSQSLWRRIDVGRIAIAGFDLGAESAMIVAGQTVADTPLPITPPGAVMIPVTFSIGTERTLGSTTRTDRTAKFSGKVQPVSS